jgi:hypothetical protein
MRKEELIGWLKWRKSIGLPPVGQDKIKEMLCSYEEVTEERPAVPAQKIYWKQVKLLGGLITYRKRID